MLKTELAFGSVKYNQGNDDLAALMSCSHVRSESELIALANLFLYGGEFGAEFISMQRYEDNVPTVAEFTAEEKTKDKGRLELQLVFQNGKKHTITIADYYNDETLITAMKTVITNATAGAFGVQSVVSAVNTTFTKNKY